MVACDDGFSIFHQRSKQVQGNRNFIGIMKIKSSETREAVYTWGIASRIIVNGHLIPSYFSPVPDRTTFQLLEFVKRSRYSNRAVIIIYSNRTVIVILYIGGGKGGARGLKPPFGLLRGGLAPPQNDITPKLSFLKTVIKIEIL